MSLPARSILLLAQIGESELAGRPDLEPLRRRLLETALAYYQNFLDQRRDDPSTHRELEASRARAALILSELATLRGAARSVLLHLREVQDELGLSAGSREPVRCGTPYGGHRGAAA